MTTRRLAYYIFEEFLPPELLEKFNRVIWGKELTVKDRFISHFERRDQVPKYNVETSKIILLEIVEKNMSFEDSFLKPSENEDGSLTFDFSLFDPLFEDKENSLSALAI